MAGNNAYILKQKIKKRTARVAVIGLGHVGLPLALAFVKAGFRVSGIDCDRTKVGMLRRGASYVTDVSSNEAAKAVRSKRLSVSDSYAPVASSDCVIICVQTPLRKTKAPDISHIVSAVRQIAGRMKDGKLVVLESTTYPGTTEETVLPVLRDGGLQAGRDFFLAFSPERIDPGNAAYRTANIPKVVGGVTRACVEVAEALYKTVACEVVVVSSTGTAEMVKLLENTFRWVNIGLVNEFAVACRHLGIDVWEVIDAAKTKPFGFMPFYPGPGSGGHCIPVDPFYLSWKAKLHGFETKFIDLASAVNAQMPAYVVERAEAALNKVSKPVRGARILVLGVAYKRNVNDTRESPAMDIIRLLKERGAAVSYHDPHVPRVREGGAVMSSVKLQAGILKKQDCVVIVTDHAGVDYEAVVKHSRLVVDTRNATKGIPCPAERVVKL